MTPTSRRETLPNVKICSEDGCSRTHYARGMCQAHYCIWRSGLKKNGLSIEDFRIERTDLRSKKEKRRDYNEKNKDRIAEYVRTRRAKIGADKKRAMWLARREREKHNPVIMDKKRMWKDSEKAKENGKNYRFNKHYGISLETYKEMLDKQGVVCAICRKPERVVDKRNGKPRSLAVDHCHKTGRVRGLLCSMCNNGIGMFGENIVDIANAVKYICTHLTLAEAATLQDILSSGAGEITPFVASAIQSSIDNLQAVCYSPVND